MTGRETYRACGIVVAILLLLSRAAGAEERVFSLEEVSTWELVEQVPAFALGKPATCAFQADPNVKAYPALKSDRPVYGSAQFGSFFEERNPALLYRFVADESGGPGTGYDRLYVDANGDKDLRNDAPVTPRKDVPPELLLRWTNIEKQVLFENIGIPLPFGSEGLRPLEVVPRLLLIKGGSAMFSLVPTRARRGQMEIAGRSYDVLLGLDNPLGGWFDHPETYLFLMPRGESNAKPAWSRCTLMTMLRGDETYYCFRATPAGDKLTVRPYEGPLGDFEVGGGKFESAGLKVTGSLRSRDAVVSLAGPKCRVPAGDYLLDSIRVTYGTLTFATQTNWHSDGGFRSRLYHLPAYPIAIRPDACFVLDFSHRPEIVFASPPKDHRVRLGENQFVEAVLVDPVLDFVLCDLSCAESKPMEGVAPPPGSGQARAKDTVLYPRVTISRAGGEVVAEGVMHYG